MKCAVSFCNATLTRECQKAWGVCSIEHLHVHEKEYDALLTQGQAP